jgi:hypothetical protein
MSLAVCTGFGGGYAIPAGMSLAVGIGFGSGAGGGASGTLASIATGCAALADDAIRCGTSIVPDAGSELVIIV